MGAMHEWHERVKVLVLVLLFEGVVTEVGEGARRRRHCANALVAVGTLHRNQDTLPSVHLHWNLNRLHAVAGTTEEGALGVSRRPRFVMCVRWQGCGCSIHQSCKQLGVVLLLRRFAWSAFVAWTQPFSKQLHEAMGIGQG